jgi:beta-glucosidase
MTGEEKEKKMKTPFKKRFPDNFDWGAAFASYQVSGCENTNWSDWEKSYSRILEITKEKSEHYQHPFDNFFCEDACRHDKRFKSDFDLAKKLGHNAIRCGSEPAKIMPKKGVIDKKEIARIVKMVKHLNKIGLKPYWNLWHWTIPSWWENEGGWESRDAMENFTFYVKAVVDALVPLGVTNFITMNETNVFVKFSYEYGLWPPQLKNVAAMERVTEALAQGHIAAYKIIKAKCPDAKVGVAHGLTHREITEDTPEQRTWKENGNNEWDWHFLDKIRDYQDFIGVNHYFRTVFGGAPNEVTSDLGWEMYPHSLYDTVMDVWNRYKKPIIVTEHGCADADDSRRPWFLWQSLVSLHQAIEEGVPVFGYLHWSLMDNFEWAYGFWPRFGLVKIDRENNLKRIPQPSAHLYRRIIEENGLSENIAKDFCDIIAYPKKGAV